jgi:hypothetical protein
MDTETKILRFIVWLDIFHSTPRKELADLTALSKLI